jgi:hypothetical protein
VAGLSPQILVKAILYWAVKPIKIIPWSRAVLEKLIFSQLVKNFAVFYGTRMFISMLTKAHNWTANLKGK